MRTPRPARSRARHIALAIVATATWVTYAQSPAPPQATPPAVTTAAVPRPIALDDILAWKNIATPVVSADGRWLAYRLTPVQGDSEVVIRALDGDKTYRFAIGELPPPPEQAAGPPPARSADLALSDDGRWAAFTVFPSRKEAERLRKQRRPLQNSVTLVDLEKGTDVEFPKVRQFAFAGESAAALGLLRYGPDSAAPASERPASGAERAGGAAADKPRGADFLLRDLTSGEDLLVGGVAEFAFDKKGTRLAWITDVEGRVGNGLSVRDLASGVVRTLASGRASFEKLAWTDEGDALAVLSGVEDKRYEDKLYTILGCGRLDQPQPHRVSYDPAKDPTFPADMAVSPNRAPQWTDDRSALLFGIHEPKKKPADADKAGAGEKAAEGERPGAAPPAAADAPGEDKPDLVLWHWKDPRLQSQQQVQESRDKRFSFLSAWHVDEGKFVRLADEALREVTPPEKGRWAVGTDRREHELDGSLDGRVLQDVYAVDIVSGRRSLVARRVRWSYGQSPDGSRLLYFADGHFHVADLAAATTTNITKAAPVSFVNVEDDHNVANPPVPPLGWSSDSASVLLSDGWDLWRVAASGSAPAVNLTGNGRRDQIRYRRRVVLDSDEKGIDLAAPFYVEVYGEWTKKGGLARVTADPAGLTVLRWDDASYGRVLKPKRADRLVFTRESWNQFPEFQAAGLDLGSARVITDEGKQAGGLAWTSGVRLIDYVSDKGKKLQAALFLPAGYEPGKRYPTVVYIYERLSDQMNRFAAPTANGFNRTVYTSNGYAVLMPDISYTVNDPGMSAVWCVLPALKAAIATGIVDAGRVGLQGHSWGGYQTSFLVTQTSAFRAAVAGAPLTNMVSMYSLIYKNTGGGNMAIFESSQGRFKGGYWDNWEAYVRNSPVAHATRVTTPLLLLHNDKDGAVDFTQGIEYYNTLRRLKKPVVLLQYVGENHGLRKPANQQDYTVRMKEFFDHHLKGAPAPQWWTDGVPRLEIEQHLRERKEQARPRPAPRPTPTAGQS